MRTFLILITTLLSTSISAQVIKTIQGDFGFITNEKEINVEFVYDNLKLMKDNLTNEEYVAKRSADLEKKSRGNGETWEKSWNLSRELIWNPKFLELMNKYLGNKKDIYFGENLDEAKYTLIVETLWIYPGWDAGIMKQHAKVSTMLYFVETSNKTSVLAQIRSENAPGDQWGNNYSNESRIGEGYAKTGKSIAKLILKKAF